MGLNLFKRKEVPEELPDLATDTLARTDSKEIKDQEIVSSFLKEKELFSQPEAVKKDAPQEKREASEIMKSGFFSKLQGDMNKEMANIKNLEDWYNHKFLPQDTVSNMKKYWAHQKGGSSVLGGKLKEQVNEKTAELQKIEKEWQDLYFQLVEKEEEIKVKERELKKIIAELVEVYKEKKKKR
jgi:hypothetical protein